MKFLFSFNLPTHRLALWRLFFWVNGRFCERRTEKSRDQGNVHFSIISHNSISMHFSDTFSHQVLLAKIASYISISANDENCTKDASEDHIKKSLVKMILIKFTVGQGEESNMCSITWFNESLLTLKNYKVHWSWCLKKKIYTDTAEKLQVHILFREACLFDKSIET